MRSEIIVGRGCGWIRVSQEPGQPGTLVYLNRNTPVSDVTRDLLVPDSHTIWIQYGGEEPRPLDGDEKPLELQDQFLEKIGFTDPSRRARIGIDHDLRFLLAFNTGPKWSGRSGEVWLLKGLVLPQWKKRNITLRAGLMIIQPQEGREWCGGERIRVSRSSPSESPRAGRAVLKVISETDRSLYIGFDHRWQQNLWHSWLTQEVGRCEGDLSGLGLTTIPKDLKETCASPNILDLSSNRLTEEGCTGLESFNQLTRLCLADNRLERVPQIINRSNFPVLVSLDLSHNGIRHLPPSLAYMDRLEELKADGNLIEEVPQTGFVGLRTFSLTNNRLQSLPAFLLPAQQHMRALTLLEADEGDEVLKPEDLKQINLRANLLKGNIILGNYGVSLIYFTSFFFY